MLREHTRMDLAHFAPDLDAIGVEPRDRLFSLGFEYWHTTSVPHWDWSAMLAVICGLGRLTDGVLYRPGTDGAAAVVHDFRRNATL